MNNTNNDENQYDIGDSTQEFMSNYMTQDSTNEDEDEATIVNQPSSRLNHFYSQSNNEVPNYLRTSYMFNPATMMYETVHSAIRQQPSSASSVLQQPSSVPQQPSSPNNHSSTMSPTQTTVVTPRRSNTVPEQPSSDGEEENSVDVEESNDITTEELTHNNEVDLCVVKDVEWFLTIQEDSVISPNVTKTPTPRKMNPGLWNLMGKFAIQWEKWGWYRAQKGEILDPKTNKIKKLNNGDMKGQAVRYILRERDQVTRSNIPNKYFDNSEEVTNDQRKYWFFSKETFLKWASSQFKIDLKAQEKKLRPQPNDIIRIFGIATSSFARDDVAKLTEAKAYKRSDLDGAMPFLDTIFCRWQEKFNDPSFELAIPARAKYLKNVKDLNPNSLTRINIVRNHTWIKVTYQKIMKEYNYAMFNWKKGTGGGSGAPEDFAGDWKERECLELFSDYGQFGDCDYLAYILMYDQKVGYVIDAVNDPAPPETLMENGIGGVAEAGSGPSTNNPKQSKAEERLAMQAKSITELFGTVFNQAVAPLVKTLNGANEEDTVSNITGNNNGAGVSVSNITGNNNGVGVSTYQQEGNMVQSMNLMNSIKSQIDSVESDMNESSDGTDDFERKTKRLKTLNKMLDRVYSNLDNFLDG